jgi:hypothetical protein
VLCATNPSSPRFERVLEIATMLPLLRRSIPCATA